MRIIINNKYINEKCVYIWVVTFHPKLSLYQNPLLINICVYSSYLIYYNVSCFRCCFIIQWFFFNRYVEHNINISAFNNQGGPHKICISKHIKYI